MKTSDFDYHLPKELIAQTPAEPRDSSRLMLVSCSDGSLTHRTFRDLPRFLQAGDVMVFNDSRVMPARLYGTRATGGKIELLLLNRLSPGRWRALVRPGRRMQPGVEFQVNNKAGNIVITGEILEAKADGTRIVTLSDDERLDDVGVMPLPPYIHAPLADSERYQTVYSNTKGSVAAPTAGLHFTPDLLDDIRALGVETAFVTLHVGWDSFRPIKTDDIASHKMHSEHFSIDGETARIINQAKLEGRRVISVGTTATRLLEHAAWLFKESNSGEKGVLAASDGWADIFITPGYKFYVVDALVTNFHLPKSTLLMLTSALAGKELLFKAYQEAVDQQYRFYSFGDSMFMF